MLIFNKLLKTKYILHYIFLIGLSIDILTKQLVIYMGYGDFFKFYFNNTFKHNGIFFAKITDFFNLVLVYNKGISFSMLTNNNPMMIIHSNINCNFCYSNNTGRKKVN